MAKIEHVFVLMLENRSFDHLLAYSGLPGIAPPAASFGFSRPAVDQLDDDPPHEFENVAAQINGGAMNGFLGSGGSDTMLGFDPSEVPVLIELARNNLYFDNWFCSMPGPTWPNRLFAHAASSGGLANSMSGPDTGGAVINPARYLDFENGHIFDRLTAKGVSWRIYHHHKSIFNLDFPQVLSLKGMVNKWHDANFFRPYANFASDVKSGDVAGYTFIEPRYGIPSYSRGNSQHPTGTISLGEMLIRDTYNAIFKKPVGDSSALLITWDEHGGFFDHVTPPAAVPPGDKPLNQDRSQNKRKYAFNQFGVRVPAVLISRWLPAGRGSAVFNNATFDHAAIVRALRTTFSLGGPLTNRDNVAPDWNNALLANPRTLQANLPAIAQPRFKAAPATDEAIAASGEPDGNLRGMAQIAAEIDWYASERLQVPPLITSDFQDGLAQSHQLLAMSSQGAPATAAATTAAHMTLLQYIAAVQNRDAKLGTAGRRKAPASGKVRKSGRVSKAIAKRPKAPARRPKPKSAAKKPAKKPARRTR
jgi:phospholipase C